MKINTNDIPLIRGLILISSIFILPLVIGTIGMLIEYKSIFIEPISSVFLITSIIIFIFTLVNVSLYLIYKRKVIFEKEKIYINNMEYEWYQVKVDYLDMAEFFSLSHKTIRLEYFDKTKNKECKTYIRGNIIKYNSIVSIRN